MAEPQPPTIHEGATADLDDAETPDLPKSAEDRKAAAALSSVSAQDDDSSQPAKEVDQEALGKAIKNLDIGGETKKEVAVEKKKAVKVDPELVALLVNELDLTKAKATDLLKTHDGDAVKAVTAFVTLEA